MSAAALRAEVMAQPERDRVDYALDLLEFYLDPTPVFFAGLADLGLGLTGQEARILYALDQSRGRFLTVDGLLAAAMGARPVEDWPEARAVYFRVSGLREKLARAGLPVEIVNWPEIGYRLTAPAGFSFAAVAS